MRVRGIESARTWVAGEDERMGSRVSGLEGATFDGIDGIGGAGWRVCATSRVVTSTAEGKSTRVSVHGLSLRGVLAATQHEERMES